MESPVRVGFIGLGMAGTGHLKKMLTCSDAHVVCGADTGAEARTRAAETAPGIECYADHQAMLERDDVDLVVVATPHSFHRPTVIDSLRAGKHVLCEKPLAMNTAECDEMIAAARESGRRLFVEQTHRLNAPFARLMRELRERDMGAPVGGIVQYLGYEGLRMADTTNWKGTYKLAGGGVLLDGGCHAIDLCNWFFGTPVSVSARCRKPDDWPPEKAETTAQVVIEYESGVVAQVFATFEARLPGSFSQGILEIRAELFYEQGSARAKYAYYGGPGPERTADCVCRGDERHVLEVTDADGGTFDEHVVACLLTGEEPVVTAEEARLAVAVAEAAYESARTGKNVAVPGS